MRGPTSPSPSPAFVLPSLAAAADSAQSGANGVDTRRGPRRLHQSRPPGQGRGLRAERDVLAQATRHPRPVAPAQTALRALAPRQGGLRLVRARGERGRVGRVDDRAGADADADAEADARSPRRRKTGAERADDRERARALPPLRRRRVGAAHCPRGDAAAAAGPRARWGVCHARQGLGVPPQTRDRDARG